MTDPRLRFGVIGVGIIGRQHVARLLSDDSPADLIAIADVSEDAARAVAAEHGTVAETVDGLFARDDIDAVVIAIPSGLHAETAVAALDAGKHVLLEKPIDVTVDAADRIIDAERRSGKVLTVVSQRRFAPENQFLREAIQQGDLGKITSANIEIALWRTQEYYDSGAWRGTWKLDGGGALMNQGVHMVDLILWLLGDVEEVHAYGGLLAHERIEVEDTIAITARFASGSMLTFLASTTANGELPIRVAVMGDGGVAVTLDEQYAHFTTANGREVPDFEPNDVGMAGLNDFVAAVQNGHAPLVTSQQARAAVAFIEAAYDSMRTGKPVVPR
ncbi:Gfo/Idh/MocA family protein [Microbacterium sp. JB110]|uniref:Gfo/Idh/MocA family protein n=1 Tax=Microbacterium sp. JB110 TaxID=2024477 RepID=UPI00097F0679|nr:Gfo/Idh/MocA family oxidoreductase [Microbacterium sp. JB110]RCS60087.1 gfo/Idh/MocA family oxidoreductase [Microbacterium sp. JB110]SJM45483.1 Gluconokinase / oxidoreductase domain [Frigoribacterium sp. JB110]